MKQIFYMNSDYAFEKENSKQIKRRDAEFKRYLLV